MVGVKLIKIVFTFVFLVLIDMSLQKDIEKTAREQARLNLKHIAHCFQSELKDINSHAISAALDSCAGQSLVGGNTGDVFVIDARDKGLYWDNSVDCKPDSPDKAYMTINGVCDLFAEPDTCVRAVNQMLQGYNTSTSWKFDDSEEWIETMVLPTETFGFYGKFRSKVGEPPFQLIVGQGVQKDEMTSKFEFTVLLLKVVFGVALLIFVADTVYTRKLALKLKEAQHGRDECSKGCCSHS